MITNKEINKEAIRSGRRMGKPALTESYYKYLEIKKMKKLITIRQMYVLVIFKREHNYIYSVWKELNDPEGVPELKIDLSSIREMVRRFEEKGILREASFGYFPAKGPKRNFFSITEKGTRLVNYHLRSIDKFLRKKGTKCPTQKTAQLS